MRFVFLIALLVFAFPAFASSIKSDEEIIFFRTAARQGPEAGTWIIPVHAWVFEPEEGSGMRSAAIAAMAYELELGDNAATSAIFSRMARWFLVDNESGKSFTTSIGPDKVGPTGAHGRAMREMTVTITDGFEGGVFSYNADVPGRDFKGEAVLVPQAGVSVISDIDDTIKISEVLDKKKLMQNTFLKEYAAAPGMAEAYKRLAAEKVAFHYLSSSPWQLYPALVSFMDGAGYPKGSFHMRDFRMKDETVLNVMKSSLETKPPGIRKLLDDYPQRQFILIGDSGEKDPEIYGLIAREYPGRVKHIYIRKVTTEDAADARYKTAFEGSNVPFTLFEDASVIKP
ncbi:MAG: App1 family protein [Alphaproteobacteria bacterium]